MDIEDILFEVARPEFYTHNIFRVTELPVDAEARDLSRRQATIKQALDIGVPIPLGYGRILPMGQAFSENQFSATLQLFENPTRRLVDEIFWFWPQPTANGRNDAVLQQLGRGEIESVYQGWQRERALPANEGTALHNLAVFSHVRVLDEELAALNRELSAEEQQQQLVHWQEAFACWKELLECEAFWSRVTARIRALDDPRLTTGMVPRLRAQLPAMLLSINARLALAAAERGNVAGCNHQLDLIYHAGFDRQTADDVLHRVIEPLHERIKTLCKRTDETTFAEPARGHNLAVELLDQTAPMLKTLDLLFPDDDAIREGIHDEIADSSLVAETRYGNKTDDWQTFIPVCERIEPLVASQLLRSRLKSERENVKGILKRKTQERRIRESRLCWYCHTAYEKDIDAYTVIMYGNNMQSYSANGQRRVEYENLRVHVPRCSSCARLHMKVWNLRVGGALLGVLFAISSCVLILTLLAGAPSDNPGGFYAAISDGSVCVGPIIGLIVIYMFLRIGRAIGNAIGVAKYLKPANVRGQDDIKSYPVVNEWLSRNWRIGKRPATVTYNE